ncbi:VOC family protein [Tateyamaria armeniaca]|uniref:VOC family protein n=1 Tax=Tateyamaria armeniaca TaxID=2518930 RepID=A0ABW8URL8_9RHOB
MTLRLALLKIPVTDVTASVAFYEAVLGRAAVFVSDEYGWAQFDHPEPGLALYVPGKGGGDATPGGSVGFHLSAPDLDVLHARLRPLTETASIHSNADGSKSLELNDPDGNTLKIMEEHA